MDTEHEIMAWITRADMFIITLWPFIFLALSLVAIYLLAWNLSDCVMRIQCDDWGYTKSRRK